MRTRKIIVFAFILFILISYLASEIHYPWKEVYIGALEGRAWAGMVMAPNKENAFAFRIQVRREGDIAADEDFFYLVSEVGPHSPDGGYARIKFDMSLPFHQELNTPILKKPSSKSHTLVFEWSRQDERTIIGKLWAPKNLEIQWIHYFPWNFKGKFEMLEEGQVKGESQSLNVNHYLFWTNREGELLRSGEPTDSELNISFSTEKKRAVYFVAGVGENPRILSNHIYRYKNVKTIENILKEKKRIYSKMRTEISGYNRGAAKAITNNLFWMTLYQPGYHRLYIPAGRGRIFSQANGSLDFWTIFEWDSFFSALEVSVESTKHAVDILTAVLETQYPNGNVPNWKGQFGGTPDRSQPPIGAYVVLKLFQKTGKSEILEFSYPYLTKWHSFWRASKPNGKPRRDGNNDGLLEWGSDEDAVAQEKTMNEAVTLPEWEIDASGLQRAKWESGQNDLPNWDDAGYSGSAGTMSMNCVDLNSLYTLDAWCLSQIAWVLNKKVDYELYMAEYEQMKALINEHLWNEREGMYFDRHWDRNFSTRMAASNFFPLIARIPNQEQAQRMLRHLLDEDEFWGDYVLPTISRRDPAFKDQNYWRGKVWPPTNYLIYHGLKAYNFDAIASELAKKSAELFLRSWDNFQLCPENYDARTGEAGGQRFQSWGPLLALMAVEEYLDFTPWEGFRFGMLEPEKKGTLSRISIQERHYDIKISSGEISLKEEGKEIIKTNGAAIFRHFLYSENEVSFDITTLKPREIKIRFLVDGKYQLSVDGQVRRIFKGASVKFKVSENDRSVSILLLDKKE